MEHFGDQVWEILHRNPKSERLLRSCPDQGNAGYNIIKYNKIQYNNNKKVILFSILKL